jgi:hypothetical protein
MKPVFQTSSFVFLLAFLLLTLPVRAQKETENTATIAGAKPKIQLGFTIENRFQIGTSFYVQAAMGKQLKEFNPNWGAAFRYQALFGLNIGGYFIPRIGVGLNVSHRAVDISRFRFDSVFDPVLKNLERWDFVTLSFEFPIGFTIVPLPNKKVSPYICFDLTQRIALIQTSFSTYYSPKRIVRSNTNFYESTQRYYAGFDFGLGVQLNRSDQKAIKIGFFANLIDFFYVGYIPGNEKNRYLYAMQFGVEASIVLNIKKK